MSLLDRAPHIVTVQQRVLQTTSKGSALVATDDEPVTVRCSLQPYSASESAAFDGTVLSTMKRVVSRTWPGDSNSLVTGPDGTEYDTVGEPEHFQMSAATDHWEVVLKKRA